MKKSSLQKELVNLGLKSFIRLTTGLSRKKTTLGKDKLHPAKN
jgi:hypothetical protein